MPDFGLTSRDSWGLDRDSAFGSLGDGLRSLPGLGSGLGQGLGQGLGHGLGLRAAPTTTTLAALSSPAGACGGSGLMAGISAPLQQQQQQQQPRRLTRSMEWTRPAGMTGATAGAGMGLPAVQARAMRTSAGGEPNPDLNLSLGDLLDIDLCAAAAANVCGGGAAAGPGQSPGSLPIGGRGPGAGFGGDDAAGYHRQGGLTQGRELGVGSMPPPLPSIDEMFKLASREGRGPLDDLLGDDISMSLV